MHTRKYEYTETHKNAKGPSIYDVHTEGSGSGGRMWTGSGSSPCGRSHRNLKSDITDVILSSFHAKKLVYFFTTRCLRKICANLFLSELRQISIKFNNCW